MPSKEEDSKDKKTRRTFAIPKSRHKLVNALASEVGIDITHGSEPNTPRLMFPHGVTTHTHRSSSEMTGLMLFMLILLNTECGKKIAKIDSERVRSGWIEMLERFLLYEAFLKCTKPKDRATIEKLRGYLKYLMFLYKHVVDRSSRPKGDGDNIIKFHLTLHIVDMILKYGLPANFTGGPHETRHIFFAKETGDTTQKRISTLDYQIFCRQVLAIGLNCYIQEHLRKASSNKTGKKSLYGCSYSYDHSRTKIRHRRHPNEIYWVDAPLQARVANFLHQLCSEDFVNVLPDHLHLYTELREERTTSSATKLYRANPHFRTDKTKNPCGWFDWCYVQWPVEDKDGSESMADYPCHIRSFVNIPQGFFKSGYGYEGLDRYTVQNPDAGGDYAIIETISEPEDLMSTPHHKSWFFTKGTKYCSSGSDPDLYLVPVSHLRGTLSAFRDPISIDDSLNIQFRPNGYIFIKPIHSWSEQFVELAIDFSKLPPDEQTRKQDLIRMSSIHEVFHPPDNETDGQCAATDSAHVEVVEVDDVDNDNRNRNNNDNKDKRYAPDQYHEDNSDEDEDEGYDDDDGNDQDDGYDEDRNLL